MTLPSARTRHVPLTTSLLVTTFGLALLSGCSSPHDGPIDEVRIAAPATDAETAIALPGLHNVVTYRDDLVCGGVPEGEAGFRTLAALGIKTVISVDGARPDLKLAEQNGLRYVHLPISYDTVTPERQEQLAQAISSLEGPIYVHCHHGKHRSASALGVALVRADKMSKQEVLARMHVSGTAESYTGLWAAVREAEPMPQAELQRDPASFPSITEVTGMVATMAEIDQVIDLVRQDHEAGWRAPDDHPDLVAQKETARLARLFEQLREDRESQQYPADYQQMLQVAIDASVGMDRAVRAGEPDAAAEHLAALGKSCKQCHRSYRNK